MALPADIKQGTRVVYKASPEDTAPKHGSVIANAGFVGMDGTQWIRVRFKDTKLNSEWEWEIPIQELELEPLQPVP